MFAQVFWGWFARLTFSSLIYSSNSKLINLTFLQILNTCFAYRLSSLKDFHKLNVIFSLLLDNIMCYGTTPITIGFFPFEKDTDIIPVINNKSCYIS